MYNPFFHEFRSFLRQMCSNWFAILLLYSPTMKRSAYYLCAAARPSRVAETSTCGSTTARRKCASSTQGGDPPMSFTRPTRSVTSSPSKPIEKALPASPQRTFCREIAQRQFSLSPQAGCVALQSPAALSSNPLTDGKRNWRLACSRGFSDLRQSLAGRTTRPSAGNSIASERESKT
jgi:hypothetical protein